MVNKKRLIDANDYKDVLYAKRNNPSIRNGIQSAMRMLEKQPTVDAVEVVHGEWEVIEDDYFDLVEMKCSVCGVSYGFEDYEDDTPKNYHYCPNCGAKMDGDGNG
jgi:DNA-directed RNA polymerase subunit RPC12/RpoP